MSSLTMTTIDYAEAHHMWRPLAAISAREESHDALSTGFISSTMIPTNATTATVKSVTNILTTITSPAASGSDYDNDIWRQIVARINLDLNVSALNGTFNYSLPDLNLTLNDSSYNQTYSDDEETWRILTMVGTAAALGLLILATVIANRKLEINGHQIVLESDGTLVDEEVLPILDTTQILIMLQPHEIWVDKTNTLSSSTLTVSDQNELDATGNVFVIAAILLERNLQNVANYLILSLAVADLLVACLVMPLGAVYEVSREWTLGPELCDMWTSSDVLCCTASILHLVAIALDRYWAVTNIDYIHHRTAKRIGIMILIIWCVSFLVCIAPLLGWKDNEWTIRVERDKKCLVSQDIGYQIFATASSFYLPLLVILILYWRIFQTARKRIRRRQLPQGNNAQANKNPAAGGIAGGLAQASGTGGIAAAVVTIIGRPLPTISETTTAFTTVSSNNTSPEKTSFANGLDDPPTTTDGGVSCYQPPYPVKRKIKDSADSKRERKAAKTLAIITGAFVICWLPFFVMAVLLPKYKEWFQDYMISIFLWLGYFNSSLNPIIYTIFSPEFRHAFKKILFGRNYARRRHRHLGVRHFQ